jgi:hypothetical protein
MSRIYTPDGNIASSGDGEGKGRPPTLKERVDEALKCWEAKNYDLGFAHSLNAVLYLSNGLSGLAKLVAKLEASNAKIEAAHAAGLKHNLELQQVVRDLQAEVATLKGGQ